MRAAGADIAVHIGLGAELLGQVEELVRADGIVLGHAAPAGVDLDRALVARADAFTPVVLVSKAAAGPAHQRHLEGLERANHVLAPAAHWGSWTRAHPHAFIDAGAEVLGKLAVDVAVDDGAGWSALTTSLTSAAKAAALTHSSAARAERRFFMGLSPEESC